MDCKHHSFNTIHHATREQSHLAWDNSIAPILTVKSGEAVSFDAVDASGGQIGPTSTLHDLLNVDFSTMDPVHGPIFIEGAMPGDTLQVDILELRPARWGWTAIIQGFGLLADDFPETALKIWEIEKDYLEFAPGVRIPIEPFCGEMGVAPGVPGAFSTIPPGVFGGNIDTKHLVAGPTLFLPVLVPGALFSVGDGHAVQGDGEVCGTAIETPMEITLRFTVRKDFSVPEFQFLTPGRLAQRTNTAPYYATTGYGVDLMEAARNAVRYMISYLQSRHGLERNQAYMLCSLAVDLKINQIVDAPHWIVGAYLPMSIFNTVKAR